jgi:hypothetical protein
MRGQSTSNRVLIIDEILVFICSLAEKPDLLSLLTVSRGFFHCAASRIWRDVPSVKPLLKLLPNLEHTSTNHKELAVCTNNLKIGIFVFISSWSQKRQLSNWLPQLPRLDVYATFVKKLEIDLGDAADSPTWEILLALVQDRPLLPNLQTLALRSLSGGQHNSALTVRCAEAFLCPSLVAISFSDTYILWLNPILALQMLRSIADTSRHIQNLEIFPGSRTYPENLLEFGTFSNGVILRDVVRLQNLRTIASSGAMLDSGVLQLLGDLPHLQSIKIWTVSYPYHDRGEEEILVDNLDLSINSFPALQHISLERVPASVISKLWRTPLLVHRLVSIHITPKDEEEDEDEVGATFNNLICTICQGSPQTKELFFCCSEMGGLEISAAVTNCLQQLPLQRLWMIDTMMPSTALDFRPLAVALPKVEYLDAPLMGLNFSDLIEVARHMPKLQFLSVSLYEPGWPGALDPRLVTPSPSTFCLASRWEFSESFEDDPDLLEDFDGYLDIMARCVLLLGHSRKHTYLFDRNLHTLWPQGVRCDVSDKLGGWTGDVDLERLEQLNQKLMVLRPSTELELPSEDSYLAHWLYR